MKTRDKVRLAAAQHPAFCEWHTNPRCGKPGRNRVNFEDGPHDLCDEAIEEIKKMDPGCIVEVKLRPLEAE